MERKILIVATLAVVAVLVFRLINPPGRANLASIAIPDDPWFHAQVVENPLPVLVDFSATWCPPCRELAVLLKQLEQEFHGRIDIVTIDVDEHPRLAAHYGAERIPKILILNHGKVLDGRVGLLRYEKLKRFVQPHLAPVSTPAPDTRQSSR
jgi:thioredoxin 1